ncbi:MAG: 16S rRNA (cytidine(1402)-2'-O)-methyltransferase [Pseudomonadota bacterium]
MRAHNTLEAGLYLVATPIGAARDITLRALDVLAGADVIAAEDTRNTRRLMEIHGIALGGRPLLAYHDHNGPQMRPALLRHIAEGRSVAYVSDAGTPLVADPGYALAREVIAAGLAVQAVPGPSALLAALVVSGLPTDRFLFAGFAPTNEAGRARVLRELAGVPATLVFFEAPKRLSRMLRSCVSVLGGERQAAVCRELTKKFETVKRGTLMQLATEFADQTPKGEIVLVIDRGRQGATDADRDAALRIALETQSLKDAVQAVAEALDLPRRDVYQAALKLGKPS